MEKPMTLTQAFIAAKRFSIRYNTSWFVRQVEGGFLPYAHSSDDAKTVCHFFCGEQWSIQCWVVLRKVQGKTGLMDALVYDDFHPNKTQAKKAAAAANRFFKLNGTVLSKAFAVECTYDEKGFHPLNPDYHLA